MEVDVADGDDRPGVVLSSVVEARTLPEQHPPASFNRRRAGSITHAAGAFTDLDDYVTAAQTWSSGDTIYAGGLPAYRIILAAVR